MNNKRYFGTDGIRGPVGIAPISADWILKLGWAVGTVLHEALATHGLRPTVLIGKDTRISGYVFESALEAGLCAAGVDTLLLGPMPTPAIAYLTCLLKAQIGIVISASHNPYQDNGLKFFSSQGKKLPDDMEYRIEAQFEKPMQMVDSQALGKASRLKEAEALYVAFCRQTVAGNFDLKGLKIVVDCAHGATYRIAPAIFRDLGAEVIAIGVSPDGLNINQGYGSTDTVALRACVLESQADLGIAFDGDGDRLLFIDHQGREIDGDQILYILAKWYQAQGHLQGPVVGTLMSNYGLEIAFKTLGILFERVAVGDRHILQRLEEKQGILGGESSGHIICLDSSTTGDGLICALKILMIMVHSQQSLSDLAGGWIQYPQILINVPLSMRLQTLDHPQINQAVEWAEGRLKGKGRVLLRPSGTESLLRIMVEGQDQVLVSELAQGLAEAVKRAVQV